MQRSLVGSEMCIRDSGIDVAQEHIRTAGERTFFRLSLIHI
ncbi:hypothetical protein JMUB7516_27490 [Staphylococcus aureus]